MKPKVLLCSYLFVIVFIILFATLGFDPKCLAVSCVNQHILPDIIGTDEFNLVNEKTKISNPLGLTLKLNF